MSKQISEQAPLVDAITGEIITALDKAEVMISKDGGAYEPRDCDDLVTMTRHDGEAIMRVPLSEKDTDADIVVVSVKTNESLLSVGKVKKGITY